MKSVLMIAYHYPPVAGSSGMQRTLKFSNYLVDHGWHPIVMTVSPLAYRMTTDTQMHEIRDGVDVYRCWALDTGRHLSLFGKYPGFLARPDRWVSWWPSGVLTGLRIVRKHAPSVIWSSFPIATAHTIAATLAKKCALPWVADFRDLMVDVDYPEDPEARQYLSRLEERTVSRSSKVVFTTPGSVGLYSERYPNQPMEKWACIRNGFDDESIDAAQRKLERTTPEERRDGPGIRLVHSGILYPSERDPTCFLEAVAQLKDAGALEGYGLEVILRGSGHVKIHEREISRLGIGDIVSLAPMISYQDALAEMMTVDGLLIFQAANCNNQIPAKIYEYFAAGKPILAVTDLRGETAETMREAGLRDIVDLTDTEAIKVALIRFLDSIKEGNADSVDRRYADKYSRRSQTGQLVKLLNELAPD